MLRARVTEISSRPGVGPHATDPRASEITERDRSIGMAVVLIGTVMVTLDTTIVNVALPQIRRDLGGGSSIEWVVTAYLLAIAVSQPATGWAADRFGRRRIYLLSLAAFTGASLAAALSVNLPMLVAMRVLQGFGGGALMPVGMAIVYELYPIERRGRAMALWGVASMASPAIGPTLGGFLVTRISWHWLFLINVPVGTAGVVFGLRQLATSVTATTGGSTSSGSSPAAAGWPWRCWGSRRRPAGAGVRSRRSGASPWAAACS